MTAALKPVPGRADGPVANYRSQVAHDIRHELGTIMMLASALMTSKDIGGDSRMRVEQLLGEAHWLDELIRAYDTTPADSRRCLEPVRLDELTVDIVRSVELSGAALITVEADPVSARVDRLALWRAVRNVVCNACGAAGSAGTLAVRVASVDGLAVIEVDDDGPGFDPAKATTASLGLKIVAEFLESCGGSVEIGQSSLGGCRVRLLLPEADDPSRPEAVWHARRAV
jgi:signal transduction histidine kinase